MKEQRNEQTPTLTRAREAARRETLRKLSDFFTAAGWLLRDEGSHEFIGGFTGDLTGFLEKAAYPMNVSILSTPELTRLGFGEVAVRMMTQDE